MREADFEKRRQLNVVDQIAHFDPKSLCHPHQGVNARRFFTALNFTNIYRMQVGFLGKFFLTQTGALSEAANGLTNDFLISRRFRHSSSSKQEAGETNTVHSPLFYACLVFSILKMSRQCRLFNHPQSAS
jgi:hypothetical protein